MKEVFQSKAPEALAVLVRCLESPDDRIAMMAAQAILDRGYGKPVQSIDANVTEDGGPIRYYAELPRKDVSPEAWSERVGPVGTGTPPEVPKKAESAEAWLQSLGTRPGCVDPGKAR